MTTLQELKDYYSNLLIIQYNDKPKAKATVELFVAAILGIDSNSGNQLIEAIRDGFDIDTAVGVQLDVAGKIVGVDRLFKGQVFDNAPFFSFTGYAIAPLTNQEGFSIFSDFDAANGSTLTYLGLVSTDNKLNDSDFRIIIKLKTLVNNIDYSEKSIDEGLYALFGNDITMSTLEDMTMTYFVPSAFSALVSVILEKQLLPKPMGVAIDYVISQDKPFSGFATYYLTPGDNVEGWATYSTYSAYDITEGETLNYNKLMEA